MIVSPHSAMVLAAGLGTRMRPLTETTAKPLLTLGGRSLLDYALDHLAAAGVERVAVNAFWQADAVVAQLAQRPTPPRTIPLREDRLLDTGGGVKAALPVLGARGPRARPVLCRQRRCVLAERADPGAATPYGGVRR